MNIVYIIHEIPYPANHGNRVNTWNWIKAMQKLGHNIYLVAWYEIIKGDFPKQDEINAVKEYTFEFDLFRIKRNFSRLIQLAKYPSLTAARILSAKENNQLLNKVTGFKPDCILVDSIFCAETAFFLKRNFNIPLSIRLNNIEHYYYWGQYKIAKDKKLKIALFLNLLHLKSYEKKVIANCDLYTDVSASDLAYWKKKGYMNGIHVPPLHIENMNFTETDVVQTEEYDIGFIGSLNSPNNVQGIEWFIKKVLPRVIEYLPNVKIVLIGSSPSKKLLEMISSVDTSISLIKNVPEISIYYNKIKVLINPVQFGSGVNVKSIDMLFTKKPVVCTTQSIKGLTDGFNEVFEVTDVPEIFAKNITNALENLKQGALNVEKRLELRKKFDENVLTTLFKRLNVKNITS